MNHRIKDGFYCQLTSGFVLKLDGQKADQMEKYSLTYAQFIYKYDSLTFISICWSIRSIEHTGDRQNCCIIIT